MPTTLPEWLQSMPMPDRFSDGQLFAYSALAGKNDRADDWCGRMTEVPGEIRFTCTADGKQMLFCFAPAEQTYDVVLSDLILADEGVTVVTFADAQTIVGRTVCMPRIRPADGAYGAGNTSFTLGAHGFALSVRQLDAVYQFALCRRADEQAAIEAAEGMLDADADALADAVLEWYWRMPVCPDQRYAQLWYKSLSVNRVSVFSPQNGITRRFTTANRLSFRDMRMWDSCFHAMAMVHYDPQMALDAVFAVLECQRADGFIPCRMRSRSDISDFTAPPILCMTIWYLYEATEDVTLLREAAPALTRYLEWDLAHRTAPSGLMTYGTTAFDGQNRFEESGMDNSPRFDTAENLFALDFSVCTANEMKCLASIYAAIGDIVNAMQWDARARMMAEQINGRLWDAQDRCYYDRTWNGEYCRVLTPVCFLPLFAALCDPRQARLLVQKLETLMRTDFPIPSAADAQGGAFTRDNWRGGVWLHYNYFVYIGLLRYGYGALASQLREKTLKGLERQFGQSGNVYSFYDPCGGDPMHPDRKAALPTADYNPSAAFIQLFLRG